MREAHFTRFTVRGDARESVIDARRTWTAEHEEGGARFRCGLLVALGDGEWLDVSIWDQPSSPDGGPEEDAAPAEFIDRIEGPGTEILGQETGLVAWIDSDPELPPAHGED